MATWSGTSQDTSRYPAAAARLARSLTPRERRAVLSWLAREHPPVFAQLQRFIEGMREVPS